MDTTRVSTHIRTPPSRSTACVSPEKSTTTAPSKRTPTTSVRVCESSRVPPAPPPPYSKAALIFVVSPPNLTVGSGGTSTQRSRGIDTRSRRSRARGTWAMMIVSERWPSFGSSVRRSDPTTRKFNGPATGACSAGASARAAGARRLARVTALSKRWASSAPADAPATPTTTSTAHTASRIRISLRRRRRTTTIAGSATTTTLGRSNCGEPGFAPHSVPGGGEIVRQGVPGDRVVESRRPGLVGEHHALVAGRAGPVIRTGQERQIVAAQAAELPAQIDQREVLVDGECGRGRGGEVLEPGGVRQRPAAGGLVQQRPQELLLVLLPGEVAIGVLVALANVVQRLRAVEAVSALGEDAMRRMDGRDRLVNVHLDPAQGVGHLHEAEEVDQDDVVHPHAGVFLDRLDHQWHATPGVRGVELGHGVAAGPVRARRYVDPQITRE